MFCMNCGAQLPSNAKFCLNCGAEIKIPDPNDSHPADKGQTEPVPDKEETTQQHKDDSVRAAITKYKEQLKRAYLLNAVCGGIAFFYALLVPNYAKYKVYATLTIMLKEFESVVMKDVIPIFGFVILGEVLFVSFQSIATYRISAALGQPGVLAFKKWNLPPENKEDLKHFRMFYSLISYVPSLIAALIFLFHLINAVG